MKEETESAPDSKPGPADEAVSDKTVAKPDDDGELTFSEWRQRVLAEEDKEKHHGQYWNEVSRFEPPRGKTNNVVSEQVRHKPACTATEDS